MGLNSKRLLCTLSLALLPGMVMVESASAQSAASQKNGGQGSPKKENLSDNQSASNSQGSGDSSKNRAATNDTPSQSGAVKYVDLRDKKVSLPYGEPFTISGDVADVQLAGGGLDRLMTVTTASGNYTDSDGTSGTMPAGAVKGSSWQVTVGKLAADTSATISIQFVGLLPTV